MDLILLPGLWLTSDAWADTAAALEAAGHHPVALALPGVDDRDGSATLDDQVDAVLAAIDEAVGRGAEVVVVGHSAACTLAWIAADRRPTQVRGVVLIGGFPCGDGQTYADFFEQVDGAMPFPGWEPFEGPDSDDIPEATRAAIADAAVPVPSGVATATVRLTDEARYRVPVTLICPEFSPDQARAWIEGGDVAELAAAARVRLVDIDSGHWPMHTRPGELAALLHEAASAPQR